jgi:trans-aconitate methyltransferase
MDESEWWSNLRGEELERNAFGWPHYDVETVADFLEPYMRYGPALDIGCGPGRLAHCLLRRNPSLEIDGFDVSSEMVYRSWLDAPDGWTVKIGNGHDIPFDRNYLMAYSVTVFQHLPHPLVTRYIEQTYDRLSIGGHLIFTYAVGDEDTFLSHQTTHEQALMWLNTAGFFNCMRLDTPTTHPAWNWAVGTK